MSVREIADFMEIDHKTVHRILTSDLELHNVCSVWVPHDLTDEQCQARVNCAKQIRRLFYQRGKDNILNCLATEDETWINLEGQGSKTSNKRWLKKSDDRMTVTKRPVSAKKTMLLAAFTPNECIATRTTLPGITVDGHLFIDFVRHTDDLWWRTLRSNPIHLNEVVWQTENAQLTSASLRRILVLI